MIRHCQLTLIILLLLATASCQRSMSGEERGISGNNATHPWQLPSGSDDYVRRPTLADTPEIPADGEVDRPLGRGPDFLPQDTLEEGLLPGSWVMVGSCVNERLDLQSNTVYNTLTIQSNGMFRLFVYGDGQLSRETSGNWDKTAPGVLTLLVNDQNGNPITTEMYCEMFDADFLFMWSYSDHRGYWYARQVLDEPVQQIGWNRYDSNLGTFTFTNVGRQSYYGVLTTADGSSWQLNGYLVDGILNLAWSDSANNGSGFAAFIVEDDWDRLRGTWWKNDYEARPFSDAFLAQADRAAGSVPQPTEDVPQSSAEADAQEGTTDAEPTADTDAGA
ncbi:MAG: hypothetical protein H7A35_00285 [Planctomycetales bacterium]|nr:hypothetical protein [bacterium]UNM08500.1 MAG: hypothetical protein H7A35_00285 [Planctomycetales bacterium]